MTSIFFQKPHTRKPLSRIYIDANLYTNPEDIYSNIPDYFSLIPPKKRSKPLYKPSSLSSVYNLRSRTIKEPPSLRPSNPSYVPEYITEILSYYLKIDNNTKPLFGYMDKQTEINMKMRAILIDWLVDVHLKFKLTPETLYITVNLIDKYLSLSTVPRVKLQLLGITCLFISCKYEEIYPPELKDHVYITDQTYSKEEIIKMEDDILRKLNFELTFPTSLRYLEIFTEVMKEKENINEDNKVSNPNNNDVFLFSRYLLELCLVEYAMLKYTNGEIALSAYYISYKIKNELINGCSLEKIAKVFDYDKGRIKDCSKDICTILDNSESYWLQAVKKKFSSEQYMNVANWKKYLYFKSNTK